MKLGQILVYRNLISSHQLHHAIQIQQESHQKLGKILIDCHFLSIDQLEGALQEQYWRLLNQSAK